ncbi:MAG: hypothetical protein EOP64_05335 [Sphingomonas sp.]|nr:MAG: hypothetical protein EOP64_05335 [Sphingomonas sp.]
MTLRTPVEHGGPMIPFDHDLAADSVATPPDKRVIRAGGNYVVPTGVDLQAAACGSTPQEISCRESSP